MKHAGAYLRKGRIFLQADSRTTEAWLIAWGPAVVTDESDKDLGAKTLWILSQSTENVPHPADLWNRPSELLKAAGARSHDAFSNGAKCVGIQQDESEVVFTPTRNGGRGKRFLHLKTRLRCQPREDAVADTLRAAFDACEW
jgi:hypothetical protein